MLHKEVSLTKSLSFFASKQVIYYHHESMLSYV